MTKDSYVLYESHDGVATITLNQPKQLNILSTGMCQELHQAWLRFNESKDKVAILTGTGNKAFCAGADLNDIPELWPAIPCIGVTINKPIIAAVNGWCVGGGVVLMQMSDLCVAGNATRFFYPEAKVGFTGGLIAAMAGRVPHKIAMELMLLGQEISATRAYEVGMINKVVKPESVLKVAGEYAKTMAACSPLVLSTLKKFVGEVIPKGPTERAALARRELEAISSSEDFTEGLTAFKEKRDPKFKEV